MRNRLEVATGRSPDLAAKAAAFAAQCENILAQRLQKFKPSNHCPREEITQRIAAGCQEMAGNSEELGSQAGVLRQLVGNFKTATN